MIPLICRIGNNTFLNAVETKNMRTNFSRLHAWVLRRERIGQEREQYNNGGGKWSIFEEHEMLKGMLKILHMICVSLYHMIWKYQLWFENDVCII